MSTDTSSNDLAYIEGYSLGYAEGYMQALLNASTELRKDLHAKKVLLELMLRCIEGAR